jgi:hypothetical protein
MALGDIAQLGADLVSFEALATRATTNGVPSGASAGIPVALLKSELGKIPDEISAYVCSTAGSGALSVSITVWGYVPTHGGGKWVKPGVGSTRGQLNEGSAITGTDSIAWSEPFYLPGHFTRVYFEVTAISGTSNSVGVWLLAQRAF